MKSNLCPRCGEPLKKNKEFWVCPCCGASFSEEDNQSAIEAMRSVLEEAKIELLANRRRVLWGASHDTHISDKKIKRAAADVRAIYAEDLLSRFYLAAIDEDPSELNRFLLEEPLDIATAREIVRFCLLSLDSRNILALNSFVSETFEEKEGKNYMEKIADEAENIDKGVYLTSLPRDVFLAYSSKDMDEVIRVADYLEGQSISCFVASRNLRHGKGAVENYQRAIYDAMKHCKVLVFLSSESSRDLHCEAMEKEIPFSMDNLPKQARIQFLLEKPGRKTGDAAKSLLKAAFKDQEWCTNLPDLSELIRKKLSRTDKICFHCGEINDGDASHCHRCGYPLDKDKYEARVAEEKRKEEALRRLEELESARKEQDGLEQRLQRMLDERLRKQDASKSEQKESNEATSQPSKNRKAESKKKPLGPSPEEIKAKREEEARREEEQRKAEQERLRKEQEEKAERERKALEKAKREESARLAEQKRLEELRKKEEAERARQEELKRQEEYEAFAKEAIKPINERAFFQVKEGRIVYGHWPMENADTLAKELSAIPARTKPRRVVYQENLYEEVDGHWFRVTPIEWIPWRTDVSKVTFITEKVIDVAEYRAEGKSNLSQRLQDFSNRAFPKYRKHESAISVPTARYGDQSPATKPSAPTEYVRHFLKTDDPFVGYWLDYFPGAKPEYVDSKGNVSSKSKIITYIQFGVRPTVEIALNNLEFATLFGGKSPFDGIDIVTSEVVKTFDTPVIVLTKEGVSVDDFACNGSIKPICKKIVFPAKVGRIGVKAFWGSHFTSVEFPKTIEWMGAAAFTGVPIEYINTNMELDAIPDKCFQGCSKLCQVSLGPTSKIGQKAFESCSSLHSVKTPSDIRIIEDNAFEYCKNLTSIALGKDTMRIGVNAFKDCVKLENVVLSENIEYVGKGAFYGCTCNICILGKKPLLHKFPKGFDPNWLQGFKGKYYYQKDSSEKSK